MNSLELLIDYEHFTSYFMSLEAAENYPSEPADLEEFLSTLEEAE